MPTEDRVDTLVSKLSLGTAKRHVSDAEASQKLEIYWRVLRDIPITDLTAGFNKIIRTETFLPTPAEMYKICHAFTLRREYRKSRAKFLVWQHEQKYVPEPAPEEAVSREELIDLARNLDDRFPSERRGD